MAKLTVALIMLGIFLFIILIDVYLAIYAPGNTFSSLLRLWAKYWPPARLLITFGMGLLCGHWFWGP